MPVETLLPQTPLRVAPRRPAYVSPQSTDLAQQRTLYVVNYSHLDTQWRWSFPLTIREYLPETVHKNLDYFGRFPHHVFNWTGASRYEMIKEYYPDDWRAVKDWVARGRWFPAGNQWEECDVLVPASESILRQILYGRLFFKEEFGTESQEFMLPDSFGFPASLPSLLAHAGLRGFSTQKLTWNSAVGVPFHVGQWRGVDGQSVIAALDAGNYGAVHRTNFSTSEAWAHRLDENRKNCGLKVDYLYNGAGDQGGAPHEASMKTLEAALNTEGPVKVVTGAADLMFRHISDAQVEQMTTYEGDLLLTEHSSGSLTSQAFMKRLNRINELLADAAERALTIADVLGVYSYPTRSLRDAWQLVLRGQFHDIISGTSLPKAYEFSWNDEFIAVNQFAGALSDAVGAIATQLDTRVSGVPIVVYNPLSVARTDLVEAELPSELQHVASVVAMDEQGVRLPTQLTLGPGAKRHVLFSASVPATGFVVYALKAGQAGPGPATSELSIGTRYVSNEHYRVSIDQAGDIAEILDVHSSHQVLSERMRLEFLTEFPREFPAWNMDWVDRKQPARATLSSQPTLRVIEAGPVRLALQIEREAEGSRFVQTVRLAAGAAGDRVEFVDQIDWKSTACSLKASFPLGLKHSHATYSWDLGTLERGANHAKQYEMPTHAWIDLDDPLGTYGVALLTGAKYGSDRPTDDRIRLTLLFTPAAPDDYREQRFQDWGRHEIKYALSGHPGDWRAAKTQWLARRFEQPLRAFAVSKHTGVLGKRFSALSLRRDGVALQAMKRSEDGKSVVLRLQELHGRTVRIEVDPAFNIREAWEATGSEVPIAPIPIDDGRLTMDFAPYQLRTVRVDLVWPSPATVAPPAVIMSEPLPLTFQVDAMSTHSNVDDGMNGGTLGTLPAELLTDPLVVGGIEYRLGPRGDGMSNALRTNGQNIRLPRDAAEVHILAASTDGVARARLRIGVDEFPFEVTPWTGLVGYWDNRIFVGNVDEPSYSVNNQLHHIESAAIRTDRIAWHASHLHRAPFGSPPYSNAYLFSYAFTVPDGARSLTLPKHPSILIFAISVVKAKVGEPFRPTTALVSEFPDLTRDAAFHARFDAQ
ncbi:MAG TPA: glycoside hydrolase family 38 C-terminal domain-containing protein [Polyangiaceae bacterium]